MTADHGAHNAYDDRILYRCDLFDAIEGKFGEDIILNDPSDGNPFDDMIYLDQEMLDVNGHTRKMLPNLWRQPFQTMFMMSTPKTRPSRVKSNSIS